MGICVEKIASYIVLRSCSLIIEPGITRSFRVIDASFFTNEAFEQLDNKVELATAIMLNIECFIILGTFIFGGWP